MEKSTIVIEEESITKGNRIFLKRKITVTSSRGVATVYEDEIPLKDLFKVDSELNIFERYLVKLYDEIVQTKFISEKHNNGEKSLKEVVKEQYGVDTLTPEEFRAEVDSRGWTKEMTRAYFKEMGDTEEVIDRLMKSVYPEN